jgi:predicted GNAT superfamily acetyltransferase
MSGITLRNLQTPEEMALVEELQAVVWPGDERTIVPGNLITAAIHHGGVAIGAYEENPPENVQTSINDLYNHPNDARLIGFVFSFPGLYPTPDGPRTLHVSHMLAVLPEYRNLGIGFRLKRAQWQMVRSQGIDRIIWTFDPLLSRNAYLNIARLGAVSSTYRENYYGQMRDNLNAGLPSDRFEVDWWVNSRRVNTRLSKSPRPVLDLAHFLAGGVEMILASSLTEAGHPIPQLRKNYEELITNQNPSKMLLVEIPTDFQTLRSQDIDLALEWRMKTRICFQALFLAGYLVTDFIHLENVGGEGFERSFYVLSHGESTF